MSANTYRTRFATFNIGDFSGRGFEKGSEESKKIIRDTMAKVGAELWALQEDVPFFGEVEGVEPYDAVYDCYKNYARRGNGRYNFKAFLSDREIRDVEQIRYVGNMVFRHPWFLRATVDIEGREVCLICLHFDWSDKFVRQKQISQVIGYASKYDYCLIMGDFNPEDCVDGNKLSHKLFFEEEYGRFADAGYTMANGGEFGTFDTILDTKITPCPFDNILVSSKIKIENAGRVADPWMCDHALIWADLAFD